MGRSIFWLLGLGAIAYGATCLAVWLGQTRLIFFPQKELFAVPADFGWPYEDIWIPVGDHQLHGWWLPAGDPQAKTVLFFHGNASNISGNLGQAQVFLDAGLSVFMVDYRGYGLSEGPFPNETRLYEDAAAAWNYLVQTRNIPAESIVIFGHSIGGAVAIDLARNEPQAAGLIVQSTFTAMADMVNLTIYGRLFPGWLLNQQFDSRTKVKDLQVPVLLMHGLADATVPAAMSEELYAIAPEPKQIWLIPEATHNNIAAISDQFAVESLREWIATLPYPTSVP